MREIVRLFESMKTRYIILSEIIWPVLLLETGLLPYVISTIFFSFGSKC